jgi:putative nucleotidyltransferase with HDIG domain
MGRFLAEDPRQFRVLVGAAGAVSIALFAFSAAFLPSSRTPIADVVMLTVLAVVGEEMAVEFSQAPRMTLAASNLPILLAIMFLGAVPAMVTAAVVGAWGCWREKSISIAAFNVVNFVIPAFVGAAAFSGLRSLLGFQPHQLVWGLFLSGMVANVLHEVSNLGLLSVAARLKYGTAVRRFWREEAMPFLRSLTILTALGLTVAALYARAGVAAVAVLFVPLFASQYMFKLLVREKQHLARQKLLSDQYLEMNIGLAAAMVVLLDSKDEYTASHSAAVAMYCRDMALALSLPDEEAEALHFAGLLHDLGKVGTPDAILRKDGSLDDEEWEYIHQHPAKGAEVLSHLAAYRDVADIVKYHHERLDGSGYPDGVSGSEIPELSKILAVADTYHAMTSNRPYHAALSSFEALKELRTLAGRTLESRYVEVLAGVLRDKDLAYREGTSTDFMGEYQRGRINLRLRGQALADLSGVGEALEDPAVG